MKQKRRSSARRFWQSGLQRLERRSNPVSELDLMLSAASAFADESQEMLLTATEKTRAAHLKPDRTFVTDTDRAVEVRLRELIMKRFPAHGVWGEEFGRHQPDATWQWIIDPIDGTAQFIAGIPVYATLIALARDGVPVIGVMDFPATSERWLGCEGRETTHNGTRCRTRATTSLKGAIMSTSSPDFYSETERPMLEALRRETGWRLYGGAALSYGQLAAGRTDLACDTKFQVYDFACFVPIIHGAGGVVSDWSGHPLTLASGSQVLAAATPELHRQALDLVQAQGVHRKGL
jgi:inositol-phosphate phosphatase / L-galactose 1-phosphate phosphatase / histidinol-phosphatase